jgi:hypothetical protein
MINKNNKNGQEWAKEMNLVIEDFRKGWETQEQFESLILSRSEFLNRASLSKVKAPQVLSRRDAEKFKAQLQNKNTKNN